VFLLPVRTSMPLDLIPTTKNKLRRLMSRVNHSSCNACDGRVKVSSLLTGRSMIIRITASNLSCRAYRCVSRAAENYAGQAGGEADSKDCLAVAYDARRAS
jgi:hypothetical protein